MKNLILLVLCLTASSALRAGELKVGGAWIFAVPPGTKDTAAFMTLINTGTTPLRVTGGETPVAGRVAPMLTTKNDGRMGMKDTPFFEIPAGGNVVLQPGGDHLMIYDLKAPLKDGEKVTLVLTIEPGGPMKIVVPVSRMAPE